MGTISKEKNKDILKNEKNLKSKDDLNNDNLKCEYDPKHKDIIKSDNN